MTISSTARKAGPFSGTGAQNAYPFNFKVFTTSDVRVVRTDTSGVEYLLILGADYSVALNANQDTSPGGTVTLPASLAAGNLLTIGSAVPLTQGTSIPNMGGFYPKVIEQALDKLTIAAQQTAELAGRALRFAFSDSNSGAALPTAQARSGKFLAFDAAGNPTAATGTGTDAGLRNDLASRSAGAVLIGFIQAGLGAITRTVRDKLQDTPSVFDYMTAAQIADARAGTASIDVTDACQAALNAHLDLVFPFPAKYKLNRPLVPRPGATVRGGGKSPVSPYTADTYNTLFGTELLVTNFAAFDLTGMTGVTIQGFGFKAAAGGVSNYGAAANYVAGAAGAILTGSTLCQVRDVSFHGLEYGIAVSPTADGAEADFWKLSDFTAQDCKTVVKVGNAASAVDVARDFTVSNCQIALHCNQMIDVNHSDGARVESCRFFQAYGVSISMKNTPFVTMTGVTAFESGDNNIVLDTCHYAVLSGVTSSRAGGYNAATPWAPKRGVSLIKCTDVVINGVIEHPSESALYVSGCGNIKADVAIVEPFYTNGNLTAGSILGAVSVQLSKNVNVDITASGNSYLYVLAADFFSAATLVGKVGGDQFCGVYRGFELAPPASTLVSELAADTQIGAGGSLAVATKRIWVPNGKSLVSRSFHMTSPGVTLRIGANFWTGGLVAEADGGNTSFEKKVIYTNNSGADAYYQVTAQLYNPTGAVITVPGGHKTLVSFAIE